MKRGIGYILLLLGTLYMAILYGSKGILLLFYLEIIMAITLFLFLLWVRGRIQVRLQLSVTTVERGDVVLMQIQLARESIIPMNRVGVQLEIATSGQKKKERCEFWGVITDQSEGTGMLELHYQTRMIGDVQIQIRRIWCSDFFGIMRVSVPRKKWDPQSQKDLLVLPPVCEVPVYISRKIRDYMGESDLYSTYQGGDDPSETFQIRDYQPGDRVRDIHWKLSAKEEDVMVREHGLPLGCPVVLWLDFYTAKKHKSPKRDRLIQIATYSLHLDTKPLGQDYVENFLFTQRKGYCEHFATAGTLLYREMGIPARYVSGYRVETNQFHHQKDGTYTANVVDSQAHAWSEIYTMDRGWLVADVTARNTDTSRITDANDMISTASPEPTEKDTSEPTEQVTDTPEPTEQVTDTPEPTESAVEPTYKGIFHNNAGAGEHPTLSECMQKAWAQFIGSAVVKAVVKVMIRVLLVWTIWMVWRGIQRLWRRWRYRWAKKQGRLSALRYVNQQLEHFWWAAGAGGLSHISDSEYRGRILDRLELGSLDNITKEEICRYCDLLNRGTFGQTQLSEEELQWAQELIHGIRRSLWRRAGYGRRGFMRWICNMKI